MNIIDLKFLGLERAIAVFLVETSIGPILIETGPHSSLPKLKSGLSKLGYELKDIKHVLLTHIHLDHAGAAWAFAEQGAKIHLHPRGYRHLNEPSKLLESARRIYKDQMDSLWGSIKPIPEDNLLTVEDGEVLTFGDVSIKAMHTPGHAQHHIAWQWDQSIFCGDVAGVKIDGGPVVPPCPPPDIDMGDWHSSIDKIKAQHPKQLFLTHYGQINDIDNHLSELKGILKDWLDWMRKRWESGQNEKEITPEFKIYVEGQLKDKGMSEYTIKQYDAANPVWMSVAGLLRYLNKYSKKNN